jgi:archaeosortase A (PGF-CTERM-specific)
MKKYNIKENTLSILFFIIPIIFVIIGIVIFTFPLSQGIGIMLTIILFVSLILLLLGFLLKKEGLNKKIRIIGWILFAFFWSTQSNTLYFGEDGDIFNAALAIAGVFALFYIAYHEWLSLKRKENISCLNWVAGVAAVSGIIYFTIDQTPLAMWLREVVATQSGGLLNIFTGNVTVDGINIHYELAHITLIFACTAVQSMVLFVGMILPLSNVTIKKKFFGLLITVVPIYVLNLVRNAGVIYLTGKNGPEFFSTAHNLIGKTGSLIALIVLVFVVIKIIPEVFNEIICLTDLYKRNGPLEKSIKKIWRKN